jgi:hypothetical protein|tara:strand:+ start:305 stop:427 length:123 start_codon:yes stop_codon:yes gene_type:complete
MSQQSDVLKAFVTRYDPEPEQKEQTTETTNGIQKESDKED